MCERTKRVTRKPGNLSTLLGEIPMLVRLKFNFFFGDIINKSFVCYDD